MVSRSLCIDDSVAMERRDFLTKGLTAGVAAGVVPSAVADTDWSAPDDRAPDDSVSIGFIGIGGRGTHLLDLMLRFSEVNVPAVCDIAKENVIDAQDQVEQSGQSRPEAYGKRETSYREMLAEQDLDGVVIATPWEWHIRMAIDAMEAGTYAAFEVGAANEVEECWELVKTYEETGVPSMLLENLCFSRENMMVLNMVRQGLFGELVHAKCGYSHDLRGRLVMGKGSGPTPKGEGDYRSMHNKLRNGDLYPSHGIGPIAKCLRIQRGNRFSHLASTSTKSRGLQEWAEENLSEGHPRCAIDWKQGDIVTTTLTCQNGETVEITFDTRLPRPHTGSSFRYQLRGTEGMWQGDKNYMYIEGRSSGEKEPIEDYLEEFEHPLWERYLQDDQITKSGHGGIDALELRVFVECVERGVKPPIDVYDAAAWNAIGPLSEASIAKGGQPVEFPDFTNGQWMTNEPIMGVDGEY